MQNTSPAPDPLWVLGPAVSNNSSLGRVVHDEEPDAYRPRVSDENRWWLDAYTSHWTHPVLIWGTESNFAGRANDVLNETANGLWKNKGDAFREARAGLSEVFRMSFGNTARPAYVYAVPGKVTNSVSLGELGMRYEDHDPKAKPCGTRNVRLDLGFGFETPPVGDGFLRFAEVSDQDDCDVVCQVEHKRVVTFDDGRSMELFTRRHHLDNPLRSPNEMALTPAPVMAAREWSIDGITPTPLLAMGVVSEAGLPGEHRVLEVIVRLSPFDGRALQLVTTSFSLEMFLALNALPRRLLLKEKIVRPSVDQACS